jgi:hypothetical protein
MQMLRVAAEEGRIANFLFGAKQNEIVAMFIGVGETGVARYNRLPNRLTR